MAAAAGLAPKISAAEKQKPPNVILILGDDHRWDALGCMGNKIIQTPHLDQLARDGVIFDNHFATTPICWTSRASIMLGQYARTHGIFDVFLPLTPAQIQQTYWMKMKQAGYHIGFIGKYGVGMATKNSPDADPHNLPGSAFDYWKGFWGQGNYFPEGMNGPHLTYIMRDQANEFLNAVPSDKPFCLSMSFKSPHIQDDDPRQYLPSNDTLSLYEDITIPLFEGAEVGDIARFPLAIQRSENRRRWAITFSTPELYQASMKGYYRLISGMDRAIGSIRETLAKRGLADNTVIVFSADHGIFNGEHGLAGKWYGHEEAIRIPLIIHDPRMPANARGSRRQAMTLNIDLQPTLLELAGIAPPESTQGRSLVPSLRAEAPESRALWFFEHYINVQNERFPWIPSSEGIRTRRWKYIRYTDDAAPYEELYDLEADRHETRNLAGQAHYATQQQALIACWQKWRESFKTNEGSWIEPIKGEDLSRAGL